MHYIGIDVSKKTLHCLLLLDPASGKQRTKAIRNDPAGHAQVVAWGTRFARCEASELHVVLEATGIYHEALAEALYHAGCRVSVLNPLHVKRFAESGGVRSKTDSRDRLVLARFGVERQPEAWQPLAPELKQLRALLARLDAVKSDIQRELNREETAREGGAPDSVRESIATVLKALREEEQRLSDQIDDHIDRNPDLRQDRELLRSIPGIGERLSGLLLVMLRGHSFQTARQAAAYVGLVPIEHESGTSIHRRPRLSKAGNPRIRAALYLPAVVAKKYNPDVKALYQRLRNNGKSKMAALGAAMRKLVHIAFGVLKHQAPYEPQVA